MKAENISIKYDKNIIIKNQSFELMKNKINIFIGENGCGKSTLFKSLSKQLNPFEGKIKFENINIKQIKQKEFAKKVGIMFQENSIPNDITVKELVSYGRFAHINLFSDLKEEDNKIINDSINICGLKKLENNYVNELSSGQRQLVWIAMLISQNSEYMFLDEPTTYLDLKNQFEIMNCIKKINKELNKTIVLILHDINLAAQYADYIFMMKNGEIKYKGLPSEILTENHIKEIFNVNVKITKENNKIFICPYF